VSPLRYITHAEVDIDPLVAVPAWGLTQHGQARVRAMLAQPWVDEIGRIISSDETKAVETAAVLADHRGLEIDVRPSTREVDREAVGYVPPDRYEELSAAFFGQPEHSAHGWERAVDAQARVVDGLRDVLSDADGPGAAVVGHGGVGTLLWCHLAGLPISADHDQPGAGYSFTYHRGRAAVAHRWHRIDDLDPPPPI